MPTYSITDPDGRTHTIDGPAGATREQVIAEIQKQLPYQQRTVSEQLPIDQREAGLGTMAKQGFNRAMTGLGSTVTDLIPALAGSALGFKDYAAEQLAEHKAKMEASEEQNPTAFKSFRDVRGVGDAAGYVAETFGELIPDIVALLTGAGAASVVGKRVAIKGVEELIATRAAKVATARGLVGEDAAKFTKELAENLAKRAEPVIARVGAEGSTAGLKYGLPASSYALNAPDVFGSIYEKTEEQSPGIAALMGVPIAMLDTFLPGQILSKLGMAGKAKLGMAIISDSKVLPGSFKAAALKELGTVVAAEGLTESAQEALTVAAEMMAGAKGEFFSQENIDRYINAGLKGAIGGGAFGGPGAIRSGLQAKGEKDRLAGEAAARVAEEAQRPAFELTPSPSEQPRPDFELTPSAPPEAPVDTGQMSFDFGEPAPTPTGQMELDLGAPPAFSPSEERAETARRQAQDTGRFDPTAVAPFDAATAERTSRFDPKTSAIATTQPDLVGEFAPPLSTPTPEVAPTVSRQELLGLGISKNARVSGMAQRVPLVTFLSGLPLDNPQNVNTVVTQLSAFAANPAVAPEVKANVKQFLRGLVESIQTMNTQQGALQFAPAAPGFQPPNTPMQAPLAGFGAYKQRQQQTDAQQESDFQKAEAQRVAQQQLELARQGAQREANERQKEARAVRLAQGQQQGDLFGLTYPEAPPSTPFTPRAAPPEVSPDQLSMIGPRGGITKEAQRGTTTDPLAGESAVVPSQPASSVPPGGAAASEAGGVGDTQPPAGTTSVGESAQPGALTTGSAVEPGIVHKLALTEQRNAGWDSKWPFIPADMLNADFRHLIATDPELTAVEKEQIFQAGKNLGVVSKSESVQQAAADKAAPAKSEPKRPIKGFGAGKTEQNAAADKAEQQAKAEAEQQVKAVADKAKAEADKAKQQAAAEQQAKAEVQRKINKIALNDQKAKTAAAKVVADKFAADKAAADKAAAAKAKAETDEAEQQQNNLRSEARSILSAAGSTRAEITDLLAAYDSFTPEDIADLRRDNPPQDQKPKGKVTSEEEIDKLSETVDTVETSDDDIVADAEVTREVRAPTAPDLTSEELAAAETAAPALEAGLDQVLDDKDKQTVTQHYGLEKSFGAQTKQAFLKSYAEWLVTGRNAAAKLAYIFEKVAAAAGRLILAAAVAVSFSNTQVKTAQAAFIPVQTIEITDTKTVTIKLPRADFKGVAVPGDVKRVADWRLGVLEGKAKFMVADKVTAMLYVFDESGVLIAKTVALFGQTPGDIDVKPANNLSGKDYLASFKAENRVTPAGVFPVTGSMGSPYGAAAVDLKTYPGKSLTLAVHTVVLSHADQKRAERLASLTPTDNRISSGCINVPQAFADEILGKQFPFGDDEASSDITILPEHSSANKFFPMMGSGKDTTTEVTTKTTMTTGGKTDSAVSRSFGTDTLGTIRGEKRGSASASKGRRRDATDTPDARVITPSELAAEPSTIAEIDSLEAEHTAAQDEVTRIRSRMRNPAMMHRAAIVRVNSAVIGWVNEARKNKNAYSPGEIETTAAAMRKDPAAHNNALMLSDTTLDEFYNRNPPTEERLAKAEAEADLRQEELVDRVRALQHEQDLANKLLNDKVHDAIQQQIKAGVIPQPFAPFYHAVARGDTKAALDYIAAKGANLIHRQVAKFLLVNNVFPPIQFINEQTEVTLSSGKIGYYVGTYSSAADKVSIDSGVYLQRAYPNTINGAIQTLLHELVHAGTVNAMSKAYEVYTRLLQSAAPLSAADSAYTKTGEYKSAVELFKLFDYLKKTYPKQFKKSIYYGATNPFEMVAEILTNKSLQEFLSTISLPQKEFPTPRPISAFALFVNKIKQLIASAVKAAGYNTVPNSALEHVINATVEVTRKRAGSGSVPATEQEKTGRTQFRMNYASTNVSPSAIDARIVETGVAPPLLSQQTVKNVFESALRLTEKLPGMSPERADQIHQLMKDSTSTAARAGLLAVLPLNILGEVAKKALGVHGEKVNTLVNERAGVIHKRNKEIEALVNRASNWAKGAGKPTVKLFNDVVYDSTTLEIDPTKNESDYAAQTRTAEALHNAAVKQAAYRKIKAMYNSLPPEGQKLYVEMRDAYREMYKNLLKSLRQRVNASLEDREGSAAIADGIFRKLVERAHKDPYFPLTRTGAYWLAYDTVENGQSDHVVKSFETERGRERFIREEKAANKQSSNFVSYANLKNFNYKKVPSTSFINDVVKVLEVGVIDPATNTRVHVPTANIEAIVQLFLDTLPETAFAQSFQRREQIMGYERDAIGAMRQRLFNTSRQLANMEYAPKLNAAVDNMKQLSKLTKNAGDDNSIINAYVNEYEKRIAFINNPTISKLSQFATAIGFNMLLGLNPASAVVNLSQLPMVTLPYLGGEYGYAKASAAVMNAYKIFAGSGRSKTVDVFGTQGTTYTRSAMYSLDNYSEKDPAFARYKTLMGVLETQGQMSSSQVYDTLEASDGTTLGSRVNAFTGWMFHQADRVNRQVTAIAAYDLELDRLKKAGAKTSDGIPANTLSKEERETAAANHAVYVTEMTQGGTSAASAPRIAQGAVGRVLFMFKRYGVSMMYLQLRMLRDALQSEDKAVRKAAMAQFAGMSGMAALVAGVQGLPMFGALSVLYGMFKDDDEDDLEMVTRKYMGTMLTNGPLSYVTNLDFSGRVSMSDLLFREMRTGDKPSVVASILEQLGGPVYGVASKVERGLKLMQDGNTLRGMEQILPSGIGNIFKAARFATEGANTLRGDPITGDVSIWNVSAQALGFSPSDYQRQNELNNRLKGIDKYVSEKETKLFRKYYTAGRMGDREAQTEIKDELRELFRKHPGLGSLEDALGRSMKAHEKTTSRMRSGIVVNEKLRAELERYARDAGE